MPLAPRVAMEMGIKHDDVISDARSGCAGVSTSNPTTEAAAPLSNCIALCIRPLRQSEASSFGTYKQR